MVRSSRTGLPQPMRKSRPVAASSAHGRRRGENMIVPFRGKGFVVGLVSGQESRVQLERCAKGPVYSGRRQDLAVRRGGRGWRTVKAQNVSPSPSPAVASYNRVI